MSLQSEWMVASGKKMGGAQQKKIIEYLNTIIEKSRSLATRLRPSTLDVLGLATALKLLFGEINQNNKLKIKFTHIDLDGIRFKAETINVFRVIQEAITNILKHAKASRVGVKVSKAKGMLKISIEDNGRGFVLNAKPTGLGLATMQERVKLLGGVMAIDSKLGRGTVIKVDIPIMKESI